MRAKSFPQIMIGGLIVILGIGFLLDGLNVWDFGTIMAGWWPLLIVAAGTASLVSNPAKPLWPSFVIGAGLLLLLRAQDITHFEVWNVIWPAAVIFYGLSYLLSHGQAKPKASGLDTTDLFVAFSGTDAANKSDTYRGGTLNAMFGAIKLDLREANIKGTAHIDVFAAFGGVELIVPDGWVIKASGLPIFGGWEDKTRKPKAADAPVLSVGGTCIFGGVEIKN